MGGGAANATVSEFADGPPTPDPSPPRANARGGRGEEDEFYFQTAFRILAAHHARVMPEISAPEIRGRGECRVLDAPAAARVVVVSTRVSHHEYTGEPGIPAHGGVNGFLRTLPGDRALLSPSPMELPSSA